ncbi:hypothetical protein BS732_4457 [Bacillus subtilis MB73/2]|nr:hypothetical protein BS732_4457 [Bacillus subtilis MB73/2]
MSSTQTTDRRDSETTTLHFTSSQLTVSSLLRDSHQFTRQFDDTLLVNVLENWNNQTVWSVNSNTDVDVLLQSQSLTVFRQRRVESWHLFQSSSNSLHDENNWSDLNVQLSLSSFFVLLLSERFQFSDVSLVEVSNVWDHNPVTRQVSTRDLLDSTQFNFFDFTELREVNLWPWQHTWDTTTSSRWSSFSSLDSFLNVRLNVFSQDSTLSTSTLNLSQVNTKFSSQSSDQWSSVNVSVVFSKFRLTFSLSRWSSRWSFSLSRWSWSSSFLLSWSSRWSSTFNFEDHDQRTSLNLVTNVNLQFLNNTSEWSWNFHRSLVTFNSDQRLFSSNLVTNLNHNFSNFNFVTTDVWNVNFLNTSRWSWSSRWSSFLLSRWSSSTSFTSNFENHDQRTSRNLVTNVNLDFLNSTSEWSWNFHRSLVTFNSDQRLFSFNLVTNLNQDFSNFNFVRTDVWNVNVLSSSSRWSSRWSSFLLFFSLSWSSVSSTVSRVEDHDQSTSLSLVTNRNLDFLNDTSLWRWNFHRSLVTFNSDQRLFSFNLVTNLNQDFSDFNFVSTDVWNLDFDSHFVIKT